MKTVGQQLRASREAQKLSAEEAAKITKIKLERLLELEQDDFSRFASAAYARGFVRTYAKALKLDERKLLKQLDGVLEEAEEAHYVVAPPVEYVPEEIKMAEPLTGKQIGLRITLMILAAIVGIVGWNIYRVYPTVAPEPPVVATPEKKAPVRPVAKIAPPEEKEEPKPAPVPEPAPKTEYKLRLVALEEAWVRVVVVRGDQKTEVLDAILKQGDAREFTAPRFLVKALTPAAFQVTVDGQDGGSLGNERSHPQTFMLPKP